MEMEEEALNRIADALEGILDHLRNGGGGGAERPPAGPPEERDAGELTAKVATFKCPHCSGPMQLKMNRSQGTHFAGCTNYPECKGTRSIDGKATGKAAPTPSGGYRGHPTGHSSSFEPRPLPRPMTGPPEEADEFPSFDGDDDIPF